MLARRLRIAARRQRKISIRVKGRMNRFSRRTVRKISRARVFYRRQKRIAKKIKKSS